MYELPGEKCDPEDGTVFDAVAREASEETGLVVSEVLCEFEDFEYSTKKARKATELSFEGSRESLTPTLHAEEHQAYVGSSASLRTLSIRS